MELPAGLAAVSLRLHGGPGCRPPISRQGSKTGFADVILWAMGLRAGSGADAYVWAEAEADVAALLQCYSDPDALQQVAGIIREWSVEPPRQLWDRLRAVASEMVDGEAVAAFTTLTAWSQHGRAYGGMYMGPDRPSAVHEPGWVASITAAGLSDRVGALAHVAAWAWMQGHGSPDGRLAAQYLHPEGDRHQRVRARPAAR